MGIKQNRKQKNIQNENHQSNNHRRLSRRQLNDPKRGSSPVRRRNCGTAHGRYAASQVCMAVDDSVVAYYGAGVGEIGEERCMCIYSFRWNQKQGRNFPVVPSKTPECAVAYLTQELNVVEDESSATLATMDSTDGRCDGVTSQKNGK